MPLEETSKKCLQKRLLEDSSRRDYWKTPVEETSEIPVDETSRICLQKRLKIEHLFELNLIIELQALIFKYTVYTTKLIDLIT